MNIASGSWQVMRSDYSILAASIGENFASRMSLICGTNYDLQTVEIPDRALSAIASRRFHLIVVDRDAPFGCWENLLRISARVSPNTARLIAYDRNAGLDVKDELSWLFHDAIPKQEDPKTICRRLDALCAGTAALMQLEPWNRMR